MSWWVKWVYSLGLFLAMCGILVAGSYQYLDHLNIPYNINLFGCGTVSCTSMTIQDSAGNEKLTPGNPAAVMASPNSIAVGAAQDGWDVTQGAKGDAAYTSGAGSVIAILKGIFTNLATPITVVPSVSPQNVTVANQATVNAVTSPLVSPQNVTLATSPVSVAISTVSSPINVTGNLSTTPPAIQAVNVASLQGINIASPSTYGVAPVGSVQGVNAFVTSLPASPVSVALPGTPANVTLAASPLNVTLGTPLNVTMASPVSVAISTVSSPINVTGNLSTTAPAIQAVNVASLQGINIASPSTYGVAPVGSVQGVNAFITNSPTVVLSGSPVSVGMATGSSPVSVGLASGSSPLNVTLVVSPLNVTQSQSPQNITVGTSPLTINIGQLQNATLASPSTYGTAPVGSVQGVNAFVTSLPGSPLSVVIGNGSQATPQNVTLAASPLNVTMGTPLNVTIGNPQTSGVNTDIVQWQGQTVASPSTYGVAPVGSAPGVNAFVTNSNPNGLATSANSQPVVVASDNNVRYYATLPTTSHYVIQGYVPTTAFALTNTVVALGPTPGVATSVQLTLAACTVRSTLTTPSVVWVQFFDTAPHPSGTDVTLGTTKPKLVLAISGSPVSQGTLNIPPPGAQFVSGISVTVVATNTGTGAINANTDCSFAYGQ